MTLGIGTAPWHKRNSYNLKHGYSTHPLYAVWKSMWKRCSDPTHKNYKDYGGRGITVCDRWQNIVLFVEDLASLYKPGLQMDRINNDGNYELSNVKFVTRSVNLKNTRRANSLQSDVDYVTYHTRDQKWEVTYKFRFKTKEEAEEFARKYNPCRANL